MARFFNTTGPCILREHYMLSAEARIPDLLPFVEQKQYFVVHAARQTGKTTAMMSFTKRLREKGYVAVYTTLETSQGRESLEAVEPTWLRQLRHSARLQLPASQQPPEQDTAAVGEQLGALLSAWSERVHPTPLVIVLDEVDVLQGVPLINLLRQLRAGFINRPQHFPTSIALVGMRDLRDYLAHAKDGAAVNPGSPFNIKSASLTLRNFTAEEVVALLGQHTEDTGQIFTEEACARAFWWTQGQPYLINAIARIVVMELVPDRAMAVTAAHVDAAKERLVLSRTTHLDSLSERLKEARVAPIVQAVLVGDIPRSIRYDSDDFQYVMDLGLIQMGPDGAEPASPLYREVLARQVTYNLQMSLVQPRWRWQTPEGRLDFPALVEAFFQWWRENADALVKDIPLYPEAVPHIAFMAFLQRVINGRDGYPFEDSGRMHGALDPIGVHRGEPKRSGGDGGGTVQREYAAGRGAVDLLVTYAGERFVVEIKRVRAERDSLDTLREAGVQQLVGYLDTLGEEEGWLLIFDQRKGRTWEDRLWQEGRVVQGRRILLLGG